MEESYKTLCQRAEASFTEKKSRFIGYCAPVSSEAEALDFVSSIKAMHKTATHNVWAFSLRADNLCRYTDDGEPQGTAGLPVLDVLRRRNIVDAAIVVTRYFGGTLLGTGGLVRAYGEGASSAVASSGVAVMAPCDHFALDCGYADYDKVAKLLQTLDAAVLDSEFAENVSLRVALRAERSGELRSEIRELTRGAREPRFLETKFACVATE